MLWAPHSSTSPCSNTNRHSRRTRTSSASLARESLLLCSFTPHPSQATGPRKELTLSKDFCMMSLTSLLPARMIIWRARPWNSAPCSSSDLRRRPSTDVLFEQMLKNPKNNRERHNLWQVKKYKHVNLISGPWATMHSATKKAIQILRSSNW